MFSNAGFRVGELRTGVRKDNNITPSAIIMVVMIELVAIAIVDTTSPSSVPGLTSAFCIAFQALGAFILVMLPVTNARYDPAVPSIGP